MKYYLVSVKYFSNLKYFLTAGGDGPAIPLHGGLSAPCAGLHGAHLQAGDPRLRDRGGGAEAGGGQGDPHLCGGGLHQHEQENILVNTKVEKYLTHTKKYFIGCRLFCTTERFKITENKCEVKEDPKTILRR